MLGWQPEGKKAVGRQRTTWQRTVEAERKKQQPKTEKPGERMLRPYVASGMPSEDYDDDDDDDDYGKLVDDQPGFGFLASFF